MKRNSLRWFLTCILLLAAAPALATAPNWSQVTSGPDYLPVGGIVKVNGTPVSPLSNVLLGGFVPGLPSTDCAVLLFSFGGSSGGGNFGSTVQGDNIPENPGKDGAVSPDPISFALYYGPEDQVLTQYSITVTDTDTGLPVSPLTYPPGADFKFYYIELDFVMDVRPVWDNLSVFSAKSVNEGANLQFTVHATDPNGTPVTHTVNNLPAFCTYDTTSGLVNCNPTFTDNGVYNVTFRASSAGLFALPDNSAVAITVNNVNRAPVFNSITPADNVTGNQGSTLTKAFTYSDPDGDAITFDNVAPLPSFCSVSGTGNARTITCLPTLPAHQGTYAVTARITDNGTPSPLTATHSFNVVVTNRAPAISGLSNAAYDNNSTAPAAQTLSVTDADGNTITASVCTMTPSKSWFAFDNSSLTAPRITIQGPMPGGDVGSYTINCSSTDDGTPPAQGTASATLTISSDPIWQPVPGNQSGPEDTPLNFPVHAFDVFGGTIVYSQTGLPQFCSQNSSNGFVVCTPSYTSNGVYNVVFRALVTTGTNAGKYAAPDNVAVTITFTNVNRAPVFNSITPADNVTGNQGSTLTKAFTYSDPDGDAITFDNVAPLPSFCSVSGTGNARTITCLPTLPAHQGTYAVTARITDNGTPSPLTATHSFNVVVTNRAPAISGLSATNYDNNSSTLHSIPLTVTDADGNSLVSVVGTLLPSKGWFTFDNSTLGSPAIRIQGPMPSGDVGSYTMRVTACDGGTPAMCDNVSAVLTISSDPIWQPVPGNQTGNENTPFNFTANAVDPLGGTIVYSGTGLPSFCSLNTSTGQVSCAPTFTDNGVYNAVFRARSTSGPNSGKFAAPDNTAVTIMVANVNRAPVFGTITPAGDVSGLIGSTLTKTFPFSDPDGDAIAFDNVSPLPPFCSVSGTGGSRTVTCTPTLASQQGTYAVTARITDNGTPSPLTATHSFNVVVTNRAPVISVASATQVDIAGGTVNIPVTFTDPDGNGIPVKSCTMSGSPAWFSFDAGTNTISVTIASITFANDIDTASGQKTYNFTCNATDNGTPATPATSVPGSVTLFKNPQLPGVGTVAPTSQRVTFTGGSPTKVGVPSVSGDEIYVFSVNPRPGTSAPSLKFDRKLVGHAFITTTGLSVDAYGDNSSSTGTIEGLVNGEEAVFVLFSQADSKVYTAYRVDGTGWSKVWDDTVPAQTVTLDFIDGQRIPLRTGAWNLFGYGVMKGYSVGGAAPAAPQLSGLPPMTSVPDLGSAEPLQSILNKYDRVIGNDGSGAKLWNPSAARFSSLTYLAPGYGYWVKMKTSATQRTAWLTVPGTRATGTESLAVLPGWTLLAYPGTRVYAETGYDASGELLPIVGPSPTVLASMGDFWSGFNGTYDRATSFDANGAKLWNPALPSASTMRYMAPGYGYWFHATAGGTLYYPEGAP